MLQRLALRKANGLRVRLPLDKLEVLVADPARWNPSPSSSRTR